MTKIPTVSVIIPAYNEERYLNKTLESVRTAVQTYDKSDSVEIIVVNNNSSDNTEQIARGMGVTVVFESENKIAKARNRGAACANGKYLIFLDADTLLDKNLICRVDELLSNGKVIGGGAFVEYDKFWDLRLTAKFISYLCILFKKSWGAFLFCEKEIFCKIGGFDESLYGLEELAFSNALRKESRKLNKKFVIISDCKVITSTRRLESRWEIVKTRIPMVWGLKRKLRDKKYCDKIWYNVER